MRAHAYIRVSSKSQNYKTQVAMILRAVVARGDELAESDIYAEKRSGKALARPELDRVRATARAGHIRRLYVFRIDRLTRSGIRDTFELIEELRGHGVQVVSVADGFDLDGPAAEIVLAVMAWAAKMERQAINERISAARERLESEGKTWGRPQRIDPVSFAKLKAMRQDGKTIREIAVALKIPRATIGRALALSQKDGPKNDPASPSEG